MHFKIRSKYFYTRLNTNEKLVYKKVLEAWLNYKESVTISNISGNLNYDNVLSAVYEDNPELFYVDYNSGSYLISPISVTVRMKFRYTPAQCENIKQEIAKVVSKISAMCTPALDKEKLLHDHLVANVKYATDGDDISYHTIVGPLLNGRGVCEGFARAFKLLCDAVGIPCIIISGTATNSDGITENHSWNIVRRNGKNYHVDVTWDHCTNCLSGVPLYYNVPDEYISKNHVWEKGKWPVCHDWSEADKLIIPINGKKAFKDTVVSMGSIRKKVFAVRFNRKFQSSQDVLDMVNSMLTSSSTKVTSMSVSYNPSLDCAIIWFEY